MRDRVRGMILRVALRRATSRTTFVRTAVTSVAIAIALTGCGLFDKKTDGPPVEVNQVPPNYRTNMVEFLKGHLNDPVGVRNASITEPTLQPVGVDTRYVVCVRFDAKDGYGLYTGPTDHIGIYFAGKLTQFLPASGEQCRNANYQRFPELEQIKK